MKATLLKSVVLIAMVLTVSLNSNLCAQDNFVTNEEVKDELVVSKTIYRNDGSLHRHLKYDFTYDILSRMTEKEAFKWNAVSEKWVPYYKISYTYSEDKVVMEYAKWNENAKSYNLAKERSVYELNEFELPVAFLNYKWNEGDERWKKDYSMVYGTNGELLAITQ